MDRIQLRRDSSARWAEINPILLEGEVGYEIDTKLRKIGDGVNRWNDLEYLRAEGISQETGDSENLTMSQKAITRELAELGSEVGYNGVTYDAKTNRYIKELYLENLKDNKTYIIYNIFNSGTSHYISIAELVDDASDIVVAVGYANKDLDFSVLKISERDGSGVNGYCCVDWSNAPSEYNSGSVIRKEKVVYLDSNPRIASFLTEEKLKEDDISLKEYVDDVRSVFVFTDAVSVAEKRSDSYSRYSDGYMAKAGASTASDAYVVKLDSAISIRCFCGLKDDVPSAIAFYSSDEIGKNTYIKDASVQGESTSGRWFSSEVPSNAKAVVISNVRTLVEIPKIILTSFVTTENINKRIDGIIEKTTVSPFITDTIASAYILAENGSLVKAGSAHTTIKYSVKGLSSIKVSAMWYDNLVAAIAFYKEDGTYLSEYTVNGVRTSDVITLEANVPSEASYAMSCGARSFIPIVETASIGAVLDELGKRVKDYDGAINSGISKSVVYPTSPCVDYHHLFIDKIYTASEVTIPCQSVFDVYVAAKLGFKMIEANVLITSDGVAVTGHQVGTGNLQTLTNLNGDVVEVNVPSLTFNELRTNYRYKSIFPQYRIPITSLEEFLYECRRFDLTPFVQCVSDSVVELTESIMGKRYVAYNGTRAQTDVTIFEYKGGTIDEIVERCKDVGAPLIYGVSSSVLNAFTDDEIKTLVARVHAEGCWLAWAGSYHSEAESQRYRRLGLDGNASGYNVPDFEIGDEYFYYGNSVKGFSDFKGTFVEDGGVARFTKSQYMSKSLAQKSIISKASLHIQFKGDIGVTFGKINERFISDGSKEMVFTSILENSDANIYIYSYGDSEVYNVSYKVSSVI